MERFIKEIKAVLPEERVYTDELRTLAWGTDASFYRLTPKVVIRAKDEDEVSRIVKVANKYGLPFAFRAAGTSLSGQSVSDSILIVAGKHWEDYSVAADANSITLQPGIVGARVNQILKPLGRVFPPDPASIGSAMVGGIVANNASGMNCGTHANSDRMLLSARLVLPDGTVLDTGDDVKRVIIGDERPQVQSRHVLDAVFLADTVGQRLIPANAVTQGLDSLDEIRMGFLKVFTAYSIASIKHSTIGQYQAG